MFQMIVSNLVGSLVRALRAAGRALRRLAKRVVDPVTGAVRWAHDRSLDLVYDGLDLMEHAAAVPGALLGAALGNRPPEPGDLADIAVAADRARAQQAEPRASLCVAQKEHDIVVEAFAAVRDRLGSEQLYQLPDTHAYWVAGLLPDERAVVAATPLAGLRAHLDGSRPLPGIPALLTQEQVLEHRRNAVHFDRLLADDREVLGEMADAAILAAKRYTEQLRTGPAPAHPEPEPAGFRM